jgi:hypothetical protein
MLPAATPVTLATYVPAPPVAFVDTETCPRLLVFPEENACVDTATDPASSGGRKACKAGTVCQGGKCTK